MCLDLEGLVGLRNPWLGEAFAFLELGVAVSSATDLRYSTEDEEAEELCCAEELGLAEEVLLGLRIYWAFLTQFCETDSGTGPNKSAEKKLEPKRASLVLADPAPPLWANKTSSLKTILFLTIPARTL